MERDYGSRKFITTNLGMAQGTAIVIFGALAKVPEGFWTAMPPLFILYAAGIAAYNWSNLRQSQNGSAPR
jgi:hypothetical protein